MIPHPESPRAYCDRLGLKIDLSRQGSPAIIGPTGKLHFHGYGRLDAKPDPYKLLRRLCAMKGV